MGGILIVEDEPAVRLLVQSLLSNEGYDVNVAAEPTEAIEIVKQGKCFDLLLSDVVMPAMNGHQLAQVIVPRCPRMRVLLMSGYDNVDCTECPCAPRCHTLPKPFSRDQLLDAVRVSLATAPCTPGFAELPNTRV
jgi:two-component system cell cycle sensor histidine kinase/response regulator CckA